MKKTIFIIAILILSKLIYSQTWIEVGGGVNGTIYDMIEYNSQLVVVGDFTDAGGLSADGIAFWDGTNWTGYSTDSSGIIDLTIKEDTLFGVNHYNIFYWDQNKWNYYKKASYYYSNDNRLYTFQNTLYVLVNNNGSCLSKCIADSMITILFSYNSAVSELCIYNNNLYASGCYSSWGSINSPHLGCYNGYNWIPIGITTGFSGTTSSLTVFDNHLYVSGSFSTLYGDVGNNLVRCNGWNYYSVPDEPNGEVYSLFTVYNKMYATSFAGYGFDSIGNVYTGNYAVFDGTSWTNAGNFNSLPKFYGYNGITYAAGWFTAIDGDSISHIAYLDETSNVDNKDLRKEILIYPNPFNEIFTISMPDNTTNAEVVLYNVLGKQIEITAETSNNKITINGAGLKTGVYFVELKTDKGSFSEKVIKR